ncbi:MAG: hypothetical protein NDI75_08460 [Candidatus Didemnitutus sp.]|nr:hypothetical protein [Candidatus Didemnitutus sp.]
MLTFRPSKTLARRLQIAVPVTPPPVANRVADWCVHEFRDRGCRYLIFCNTASLYPLVTSARVVDDESTLIKRGIETMRRNFAGTELEFQFQRWIVPEVSEVQWAPIPGRAVLGSINELICLAHADSAKSPVELSSWLAQAPLKVLGYESPDRVFPKLRGGPTA